jgi:streptogramin lyase
MKMFPPRPVLATALLTTFLLRAHAQPYTFGTGVGSADNPGSNDGTNGTAQFTAPTGLTLDTLSNLFVADGNAIRKISRSGTNWIVRTLAGAILPHGFADGTNGAAQFNDPQGVAVDGAGNLYVADTLNNAIRRVTPVGTNWVVATIAGPVPQFLPPSGSADGTNNNARFYHPSGIAADALTNLYVGDSLNNLIRKISPAGTNWVVSTLAGSTNSGTANGSNSVARFNTPSGIAVDNSGALYVADLANNAIRKLTQSGTNWAVTTLAGTNGPSGTNDGLSIAARFNLPQCVAVDAAQNLYVTDSANFTIRKITPGGVVSTLAGLPAVVSVPANGTGDAARFAQPYGMGVDPSGELFVTDYLGYAVRQGNLAAVLRYSVSGTQFVLSWPAGLTGYVAQIGTNLSTTNWTSLTNTPTLAAQYWFVTNSMQAKGFYRLKK